MDFAESASAPINDPMGMPYQNDFDNTEAAYGNDYEYNNPCHFAENIDKNSAGQASLENTKKVDFFDIVQMKSAYPKVSINLLGNLHQYKVIHVIEEG